MQSNFINSVLTDGGDIVRRDTCLWNPLSVDPVASQFSSYAAFQDTTVVRPLVPDVPVDAELTDGVRETESEASDDAGHRERQDDLSKRPEPGCS